MAQTLIQRVSWINHLPMVPDWVRQNVLAALVGATAIGIAGTIVFLATPVGHVHTSFQAVWVVLWSLTTLLALAGAYISLVDRLDTDPSVNISVLPEDEQHVLEPIIETPGMTQQEVVARSGFSDAKVSQTLKGLRERGLVYREPQGRTYRLYPGELLTET